MILDQPNESDQEGSINHSTATTDLQLTTPKNNTFFNNCSFMQPITSFGKPTATSIPIPQSAT
jgi:hypothetical protein